MWLNRGSRLDLLWSSHRFQVLQARYPVRALHYDGRNRLSSFWTPTGGIAKKSQVEDANDLLIRAGFLRQVSSGIFHLLPLGLRVQEKLERLVDKHMQHLGASKLSLSSLSLQSLWRKTGRLSDDSEVFRVQDRRGTPLLLAPTHEEEITSLVSGLVKSYKDLPLRVYQISRKYRDEPRPRQGLLRGKEFVMKDLYTFDYNSSDSLETYNHVRDAYIRLFDEIKLPYYVAVANSGNMGGSLSHEFHIPSPKGEDTIINCSSCSYTFNEEVMDGKTSHGSQSTGSSPAGTQQAPASMGELTFISNDKKTLIRAYYPKNLPNEKSLNPDPREVSPHAVASITRAYGVELDLGVQNALHAWQKGIGRVADPEFDEEDGEFGESGNPHQTENDTFSVLDIFDFRVREFERPDLPDLLAHEIPENVSFRFINVDSYPYDSNFLDLLKVQTGDVCPNCGERDLEVQSSIELAHTFNLGTRYSDSLQAKVAVDPATLRGKTGASQSLVPLEMGCHGIGISRMIPAIAGTFSDSKGLNWPRAIAPFEVAVVAANGLERDAERVYDALLARYGSGLDVILDDREKPIPWKLGDADLIGYPILVVVGKSWSSEQKVEVQCRRLDGLRTTTTLDGLPTLVASLLEKL